MRSMRYLVLTLVLAAGCRKQEPPSASRPASTEPPAAARPPATPPEASTPLRASRPARELMKDHFTAILQVRDALIVGNLELAKWNASFLTRSEADPGIASWSAYVGHLREQGAKVAAAPTLAAAAAASTELALECGHCHAANGVKPAFPVVDRRVAASGTRPHMLRHQWAAEQMWDGLIGPSEPQWDAGVAELAEAPIGQDELLPDATPTPAIAKLGADVHALGAEGGKATTWAQRADVYGRLLATCAACHAALPGTPKAITEGSAR